MSEADETEQAPTLRESLESAVEATQEADAPEAPPAPVEAAPVAPEAAQPAETAAEKRARDEAGRFAKAKETAEKVAPLPKPGEAAKVAPVAPVEPVAPAAPALKAPQSWKPSAREAWSKLPAEAQAEVVRREAEIAKVIEEHAPARRLAEEFQRTVAPFEAHIRAEGSDPMRAIGNLFQTALALRTAPPAHKAQVVAQMVKAYGVPIEALDAALAGQPAPQGQQPSQQFDPTTFAQQVEQRVRESIANERAQAVAQRTAGEVEKFMASKEFAADLRQDMADLVEVAHRRGVTLTLEEAYNRAAAMHPEISAVLKQREAATAAGNAKASTQRSRLAASSVKPSSPGISPGTGKAPSTLRESLEAAFSTAAQRT